MDTQNKDNLNSITILGHPQGLFFLFFTEMWERFSYYGMRSLLVLFLISSLLEGGWGWSRAAALNLYGSYLFWVYVTGIVGGYLADRVLGARKAVVIGGIIISAGHICLAFGTHTSFYAGLALLVAGTGLFKPNISTIVGQLYGKGVLEDERRDAGYTLFYMGINSGAFFGMALCGYIGEKIAWSYGFGLAGIFMILGALQFYFAQTIFGGIGQLVINKMDKPELDTASAKGDLPHEDAAHIVRDRLIAIGIFSAFTIFFWMAFEQAGGSMTIFAADYTDRSLDGVFGLAYKIINTLLLTIPAMVLSWVLYRLSQVTAKRYPWPNLIIFVCIATIWGLLIWMLVREFEVDKTQVAATWFGILNAFFIILLAPLYSTVWQNYWSPSGPIKFALGLILLGLGFAVLAYGASGIPSGARTASVSMIWLVLAYLLHTMGELCLSPVGLSYISKLAPSRLLGLMFGVWFIMNAIANKLAGMTGSLIDLISTQYSLSTFFLIFALLPIGAGLVLVMMNKWMLRKMHGVL